MKFNLLLSLLSLCILSSCNSTNLSSNSGFNDFVFINPLDEDNITAIIDNLNENLTLVNKANSNSINLSSYGKIEEEFLSLTLDIPMYFSNGGDIINYMAFNVNRTKFTSTFKDDYEKQVSKNLLTNNNFRKAISYGFNKDKLISKNQLNCFTYMLRDYITNKVSYDEVKANKLLSMAKNEENINDEQIHLDVNCIKNTEQFAISFKENIEDCFNKQIIIDVHLLNNIDFYKANEELFDYDINLNISWVKDTNNIDAFISPLMDELLKYNGIGK